MKTTIGVVQMACAESAAENIAKAESLVRRAAKEGACIILLPELFEYPYFCKTQRADFYARAKSPADNPAVNAMQKLAAELSVVIPTSFYEKSGNAFFNSLALIDTDGKVQGVYRKSHIPDGPGYQEKFYFSPGDSGFCTYRTEYGEVGAAICWDQWFPESARILTLLGADILLYPTAIGSEPHLDFQGVDFDSSAHWRRTMQGHAAANLISLAAANRIGEEVQKDSMEQEVRIKFYGQSFIADSSGEILASAEDKETVICAEVDLIADAQQRATWGIFRDRRPDLYSRLLSL